MLTDLTREIASLQMLLFLRLKLSYLDLQSGRISAYITSPHQISSHETLSQSGWTLQKQIPLVQHPLKVFVINVHFDHTG